MERITKQEMIQIKEFYDDMSGELTIGDVMNLIEDVLAVRTADERIKLKQGIDMMTNEIKVRTENTTEEQWTEFHEKINNPRKFLRFVEDIEKQLKVEIMTNEN